MKNALHKTREPNDADSFTPEVEQRREDYEAIAQAFALLVERIGVSHPDFFDLPLPYEITGGEQEIDAAITQHFDRLHHSLDWFDPRVIRKFYVEMRLMADQSAFEMRQANQRRPAKQQAA